MPGRASEPFAASGETLDGSLRAWRAEPWGRHLLTVAVFTLVIVLRFGVVIADTEPRDDEEVYLQAFALAAEGRSPYEIAYYYPQILAHAGAWLLERGGTGAVLAVMRTINVAGLVLLTWLALAWWSASWRRRLLAGSLYLALAPAVRLGMLWGNLSFAVGGMIVGALLLAPRRPLISGAVLGLSTVIKPLAPAAIVALGAHRPASSGRWHQVAAGTALAVIAIAFFARPGAGEMLAQPGLASGASRNVSLHRLLYCFDLSPGPLAVTAAVMLATIIVVRRRRLNGGERVALAGTAAILATPVVWSHTLLLTLPLQVQALALAAARSRGDGRAGRRHELAAVIVAFLAIQLCEGVGGIDDQPLWVLGLVTAPPALAPFALAAYLLAAGRGRLGPKTASSGP